MPKRSDRVRVRDSPSKVRRNDPGLYRKAHRRYVAEACCCGDDDLDQGYPAWPFRRPKLASFSERPDSFLVNRRLDCVTGLVGADQHSHEDARSGFL